MLNGVHPYRFLYWDAEEVRAIPSTSTPLEDAKSLTEEEFDRMKSRGNIIVGLAMATLEESHDRDDVVEIMTDVLAVSLQMESCQRCRTVGDLISMFCGSGSGATSTT